MPRTHKPYDTAFRQQAVELAFQSSGTKWSEWNQRAGAGRERLRSEVKWSGTETPESGPLTVGSLRVSTEFRELSSAAR